MRGGSSPGDGVARPDTEFSGAARRNFQYSGNRLVRPNRVERIGRGIGSDRFDCSVAPDEDDIQRDHRILHPETRDPVLWKRENHALVGRHFGPEHQAPGLLGAGFCHFDDKVMHCVRGLNTERDLPEACFGQVCFGLLVARCGFTGPGIATGQAEGGKQHQGKRDRL